jgi:hypothetical protein
MSRKKPFFTLTRLHQILYPQPRPRSASAYQALPAQIAEASRRLGQAHDLPYVPVSPLEQRRAGGQIFERAQEFVDAMAEAMQRDPEAFSGCPHTGEEIAARQAAADAWRGFAAHLFGLAHAAQKTCHHEQAGVVSMARACLDHARGLLPHLPGGERRHLRDLLSLPLLILDQVHGERVARRPQAEPPEDPTAAEEKKGRRGKKGRSLAADVEASFWAGFTQAGMAALRQLAQDPPPTDAPSPPPQGSGAADGPPPPPRLTAQSEDILTRFLRERLDLRPAAEPRLPTLEEAQAAYEILVENSSDLVALDEATRARLRSRQNEMAPELLDDCADGLRRFPELSEALGLDPRSLLHMAGQGTAIGGVVKANERCYEAAATVSLLLAEEAEKAMDEVEDALRAYMISAERTQAGWSALANIFADGIRLRRQIQADRSGAEEGPRGLKREQGDCSDQVARFLAAIERGEA